MIEIQVNGELREIPLGSTVHDLLTILGLDRLPCAVERNLQIVTFAERTEIKLSAGDQIEIVSLVGGG